MRAPSPIGRKSPPLPREIRIARKSLTLVQRRAGDRPDRPGARNKPMAVIVGQRCAGASRPRAVRARQSVGRDDRAGGVAAAVDAVGVAGDGGNPAAPSSATARASRNSPLRPPLPLPRMVTVVSPPEISTQGAGAGCRRAQRPGRDAAMARPTSRASPSIASPRITGATSAGARGFRRRLRARPCGGGDDDREACARQSGSPGFGVSHLGIVRAAPQTAGGTSSW